MLPSTKLWFGYSLEYSIVDLVICSYYPESAVDNFALVELPLLDALAINSDNSKRAGSIVVREEVGVKFLQISEHNSSS